MKSITSLLPALAGTYFLAACTTSAVTPVASHPAIRMVAEKGMRGDMKLCADGRLLVFRLGHEPDCQ